MFKKILIANRGEIACRVAVVASLALLMLGLSGANAHTISSLYLIAIRPGENHIGHFSPDGRNATVIKAWRGNGNAHGYFVYLVLMPGGEEAGDFNIVGIKRGNGKLFEDQIADEPHTGENYISSIRFAHAKFDGKNATLLIRATRLIQSSIPSPSFAEFDVYRLSHGDTPGTTSDYFEHVQTVMSKTKFCNSEMAITRQFGFPVGEQHVASNTKDGCS